MYRGNITGWLKHFDFMLIDLLSLQLAFFLSFVIRHGWVNPYHNTIYRDLSFVITFADLCVIFFLNSYKNVLKRGFYREFSQACKQIILVILLSAMYMFTTQSGEDYSRTVLYLLCPVYLVVSYLTRILWKGILRRYLSGRKEKKLFIVTDYESVDGVLQNMTENTYQGYAIVGIAITDQFMVGQKIKGIPVVADEATAASYIGEQWIDEVLIAYGRGTELSQKMYEEILMTGVTVHYKIAEKREMLGKCEMIERIGDYTVLTTSMKRISLKQAVYKRILDIAGGLVGSIITLFLTIFLGPVIYFQSPGPIFFSQTRIGKNGKKFRMYKFRSMYPDAEERKAELLNQNKSKDGMMFKLDFDPRVIGNKLQPDGTQKTGIGDFIRRTSLDEFPQFFNVLKGEMSLVGTRPPTVDEWEKYELHHRARLATKPGITGMWQVSGRSNVMDFEEVVKLDASYINEWDIGMDLKILLQTVRIVVNRDGAA